MSHKMYEYYLEAFNCINYNDERLTIEINTLGVKGWEAVGLTTTANGWTRILFKRPLEPK